MEAAPPTGEIREQQEGASDSFRSATLILSLSLAVDKKEGRRREKERKRYRQHSPSREVSAAAAT